MLRNKCIVKLQILLVLKDHETRLRNCGSSVLTYLDVIPAKVFVPLAADVNNYVKISDMQHPEFKCILKRSSVLSLSIKYGSRSALLLCIRLVTILHVFAFFLAIAWRSISRRGISSISQWFIQMKGFC